MWVLLLTSEHMNASKGEGLACTANYSGWMYLFISQLHTPMCSMEHMIEPP